MRLNPHPAGQLLLNAPSLHGRPLPGLQHKYPETVLFFPRQGQTCHAYCTYCFRWAQFVDEPELKMATDDIGTLVAYLGEHPEVTSVLITGGDPMIMGEPVLRRYIEPLLDPRLDHLESIRIGTKSLSYWPQRFVTDPDADATLRLFGEVADSGRTLALMAHFTHPRELDPAGAGRGGAPDQGHRRGDPHPGAADQDDQRRPGDVAGDVAGAGASGHDPVLHVRGAGHRAAGLLRRAAGPRVRDLPRRLPGRLGAVPYRPRPVDVGHPREGVRRRSGRGGRSQGFRAAHDPVPRPAPGGDAVLRPLRPGRHLAHRPAARVRGTIPVGAAGYVAAADPRPGLFPIEPDEPGELMVPAI